MWHISAPPKKANGELMFPAFPVDPSNPIKSRDALPDIWFRDSDLEKIISEDLQSIFVLVDP